MPLSSVLGAQSITKPGVCTSTTRPSSPFDGQVIYETDTDTLAVYDGAGWVSLNPVNRDRNLVINGAMQIHQRGASATSITTSGYRTVDRFSTGISALGTWTETVENDAPTGSGFRKSVKLLCTTADASPAAGDYIVYYQVIEGQNLQQIAKGTASAKQLTFSFWVKGTTTGTYIVELYDNANARAVSASYTINAANTWEKKIITFPADTTGAAPNTNAAAVSVQWWLGAGTTFTSGTLATTWVSATSANRAVGQTNLAAATNNYWQVTGVQLEAGSVATPFEFEDYSTTLAKCQRYALMLPTDTTGNYATVLYGFAMGATRADSLISPPVTMRAAPILTTTGNWQLSDGVTATAVTSIALDSAGTGSSNFHILSSVASGLTTHRPYRLERANNTTATLLFSAEL